MTENDQEYSELLGFLQDQKAEVQRFAAEGVLDQTEEIVFVEYCRQNPRSAARPLLRLAERAEADKAADAAAKASPSSAANKAALIHAANSMAAGEAALKALVNLSNVPPVQEELVSLNAPKRLTEVLRGGWLEGRADLAHWYAMILANVTTCKQGQEAVCKDNAMLNFLISAFVAKPRPPPRDGYDDPLLCLGKLLVNVCALPEGRKILAGGDPGTLSTIFAELGDRGRRSDLINVVKNVCLDETCHKAVVATDLILLLAAFLYPLEKVDAAQRKALPAAFLEILEKEGAALTGDVAIRGAAAVIFVGLIRSLEGREYLRASGCKEVLRAWLSEESEESIKSNIEVVIPAIQLTEEELAAEQDKLAGQNQASGWTAAGIGGYVASAPPPAPEASATASKSSAMDEPE